MDLNYIVLPRDNGYESVGKKQTLATSEVRWGRTEGAREWKKVYYIVRSIKADQESNPLPKKLVRSGFLFRAFFISFIFSLVPRPTYLEGTGIEKKNPKAQGELKKEKVNETPQSRG